MERNEQGRLGAPFLIGIVVVFVVFAAFYFAMRFSGSGAPAVQKPLAFGPTEQAYSKEIEFENFSLSRFENMLHQQVTYLNGDISNKGSRTIRAAEITVEFYDKENRVALRDTRRIIGNDAQSLGSGETRDFQIGFEAIPKSWNGKFPSVRITGLDLE